MSILNGEYDMPQIACREEKAQKEGYFFLTEHVAIENEDVQDRIAQQQNSVIDASIMEMQQLQNCYKTILERLDYQTRTRANELLVSFNQALSRNRINSKACISIDRYTDESIIVRFSQRDDIRVTLNFTEPDYIDEANKILNVEVAYLSFVRNGKRHIHNSTMSVIVDELSELL